MVIIFQVTYNCNLRCAYCYQPKTALADLTKEDAFSLLDDLFNFINNKDSKIFSKLVLDYESWLQEKFILDFFGGEPLLRARLILDIIDYYKSSCDKYGLDFLWQNTRIKITTNGTLLQTNESLSLLNKYSEKIDCGITFEGTEDCHDLKRRTINGEKTFDLVKSNVKFAQTFFNKKNIDNKLTFDNDTVSMIPAVIKALSKMGYLGVGISYDNTTHLNREESDRYYKYLCEAIDWIVDNNIRFYLKIFGYRWNDEPKDAVCGADGSQICIGPGGILSSCHIANMSYQEDNFPELLYGTIETGITNVVLINHFRHITQLLELPVECQNCPIKYSCGACPLFGYKKTKQAFKSLPNCGASIAEAKAQLYFYQKVKANPEYPYYKDTIKHIEQTNKYDPNYTYLYLNNYNVKG